MKYPTYRWYRRGDDGHELLLRFDSPKHSVVTRSKRKDYPVGFSSDNDDIEAEGLTPVEGVWVDAFGVMHSL